ncbi:MAG: hypothetical protein M1120_03000, partial [Patescibacteria group bacterium]|nr:hypothetical protein [Patescibacteria group bacterium]
GAQKQIAIAEKIARSGKNPTGDPLRHHGAKTADVAASITNQSVKKIRRNAAAAVAITESLQRLQSNYEHYLQQAQNGRRINIRQLGREMGVLDNVLFFYGSDEQHPTTLGKSLNKRRQQLVKTALAAVDARNHVIKFQQQTNIGPLEEGKKLIVKETTDGTGDTGSILTVQPNIIDNKTVLQPNLKTQLKALLRY